jgi:hypothetical protein
MTELTKDLEVQMKKQALDQIRAEVTESAIVAVTLRLKEEREALLSARLVAKAEAEALAAAKISEFSMIYSLFSVFSAS